MAMKIRIEILSGWPVPEIPDPVLASLGSSAWAQCQLITSSQSLPFNAIQARQSAKAILSAACSAFVWQSALPYTCFSICSFHTRAWWMSAV